MELGYPPGSATVIKLFLIVDSTKQKNKQTGNFFAVAAWMFLSILQCFECIHSNIELDCIELEKKEWTMFCCRNSFLYVFMSILIISF